MSRKLSLFSAAVLCTTMALAVIVVAMPASAASTLYVNLPLYEPWCGICSDHNCGSYCPPLGNIGCSLTACYPGGNSVTCEYSCGPGSGV